MTGQRGLRADPGPLEVRFPPELPISARAADIADALESRQVVIVAGATGSGKTTQLPKVALALGRGERGLIGVTQPRRIAATSVAARVAAELGTSLGHAVGYQIRFEDRSSPATRVKFMTDGILLAEIQGDPDLRRYDTLILDEAHERSLTIDFLLGWLRQLLPRRPDLKVIVSSATIETARFSAFFGGAPIIEVEGRTYPVDVLYQPPSAEFELPTAVADAVAEVIDLDPSGDVLAFLPGEREIRETEQELNGRDLRGAVVMPLYARLSAGEQSAVFAPGPRRRVVLATNVAETSITLPGIVYVVDAGVARISRYEPRTGITSLHVEAISKASADQRKGRCGRVRPGICVRLYDEESFASRPDFTDPEIKRTGLAGVILRMKSLGLGEVDEFPFLDPPSSRAIADGYKVLEELGALDERRALTPLGARLARFPVDPRIARMILAGAELGCLRDVLIITAALSTQDPRERPRDAQQKADELHRRFRDENSDFVALLRIWDFAREAERRGSSHLRRACRDNFLSFLRMREWAEVHKQLEEAARELRLNQPPPGQSSAARPSGSSPDFHRALATGLLSRIGEWNPEKRHYVGARQTRFQLHPSSALAKKPPAWVMAFELVDTSQLFARLVARVDPEWLLEAGDHVVKRSYTDPHWSERAGRASVRETATLFGLTLARDRQVDYGRINPAGARQMFIEHALIRGEYTSRGAFAHHNRGVFEAAALLRARARRSDLLADESSVYSFFDARLPAEVINGKVFEDWREVAERRDPRLLYLSLDDLFCRSPSGLESGKSEFDPADYPDAIALHGVLVPVTYHFDPEVRGRADDEDADGITLEIPLALVPQLDPGELDWTIAGWLPDKVEALLHELPKALRRDLGPVAELTRRVLAELPPPFTGALFPALSRAVRAVTGVEVPVAAWRPEAIPPYLNTLCALSGEGGNGHVVAKSRRVAELLRRHGAQARAVWQASAAAPAWTRKGLVTWDFGELPSFVVRQVGAAEVRSFPAVVDRGTSVDLELLASATAADAASRLGIRRLVLLAARAEVSAISAKLPQALTRTEGALARKAEDEAFRRVLLNRLVDVAYRLDPERELPRDRAAFDHRLAEGAPRLRAAYASFSQAIDAVRPELAKTLEVLRAAGRHLGAKAALADVNAQLDHLLPPDLMAVALPADLQHFPRYLKAIATRLDRAIANPRKDAEKLAPLLPVWSAFLAKRGTAADPGEAFELHLNFEEFRVATFAPELRPATHVSLSGLQTAVAALT